LVFSDWNETKRRQRVWIVNQDTDTGNWNEQPERKYGTTAGAAERLEIEPTVLKHIAKSASMMPSDGNPNAPTLSSHAWSDPSIFNERIL
jgi:hypothetical protein